MTVVVEESPYCPYLYLFQVKFCLMTTEGQWKAWFLMEVPA